jgi:hypothetical protein
MRIYGSILTVVLTGLIASAASGAVKRVTLTELIADPGRYLGREGAEDCELAS